MTSWVLQLTKAPSRPWSSIVWASGLWIGYTRSSQNWLDLLRIPLDLLNRGPIWAECYNAILLQAERSLSCCEGSTRTEAVGKEVLDQLDQLVHRTQNNHKNIDLFTSWSVCVCFCVCLWKGVGMDVCVYGSVCVWWIGAVMSWAVVDELKQSEVLTEIPRSRWGDVGTHWAPSNSLYTHPHPLSYSQ